MPTNREVYNNGELRTDLVVDVNPENGETESNGGLECLIEYNGYIYSVITSWDHGTILDADKEATRVPILDPDILDELE